jgi:hypothetical protein
VEQVVRRISSLQYRRTSGWVPRRVSSAFNRLASCAASDRVRARGARASRASFRTLSPTGQNLVEGVLAVLEQGGVICVADRGHGLGDEPNDRVRGIVSTLSSDKRLSESMPFGHVWVDVFDTPGLKQPADLTAGESARSITEEVGHRLQDADRWVRRLGQVESGCRHNPWGIRVFIERLSVQGSQSASAASASSAPTPMGLDGVMVVCPSPVPHEVEKQSVMMGTEASYAGCEPPGQITCSQVDDLLR